MSFTQQVKNEICLKLNSNLEQRSELSSIIFNTGKISSNKISIITENVAIAKRVRDLIKNIYNIEPNIIVRKGYNFNKKLLYILEIQERVAGIINDLGLDTIDHEFLYADTESLSSYLKGLFLASGSINDPKKSRYHLEFIVNDKKYAKTISKLLNDSYNLNSKVLKRDNRYMIYIKEAEKISDFLRILEAYNAVLYFEDIRIYRDHKNMTNRLNNCEQANVEKSMNSAFKELKAIELIKSKDLYEVLDDKLKEAALYREKYMEASLSELSEIISVETGNKITKSGLSHRMKKIKDIAIRLERQKDENIV